QEATVVQRKLTTIAAEQLVDECASRLILKKKIFWNIVVFLVHPSYGPEGGALPFESSSSVSTPSSSSVSSSSSSPSSSSASSSSSSSPSSSSASSSSSSSSSFAASSSSSTSSSRFHRDEILLYDFKKHAQQYGVSGCVSAHSNFHLVGSLVRDLFPSEIQLDHSQGQDSHHNHLDCRTLVCSELAVVDIPELITLHTTQRHFNINTILFTQCTPAWSDTTERHYNAIKSVVLYFLPLGITSIAYLQIVRVLWRSGNIPGHLECRTPLNTISGNRREWGLPAERAESAVDHWSVWKVLLTTAALGAYSIEIPKTDLTEALGNISHWLCYANSAVNPLIYNFMSVSERVPPDVLMFRLKVTQEEQSSPFLLRLEVCAITTDE
ncbi:unnamed protein product, partial [Nesidiocoris tenuis]